MTSFDAICVLLRKEQTRQQQTKEWMGKRMKPRKDQKVQ